MTEPAPDQRPALLLPDNCEDVTTGAETVVVIGAEHYRAQKKDRDSRERLRQLLASSA